jgi:transcriptional regulator with PAS, ATPase and Fis domain
MSLLRRIVVVSRKSQLHDIAREIAPEVFVADDPAEGIQIVNTVTPEMILFDEMLSPEQMGDFLQQADNDPDRSAVHGVALPEDWGVPDEDYHKIGVSCCVRGCRQYERLVEVARQFRETSRQTPMDSGRAAHFMDETAGTLGMVGCSDAVHKMLHMISLVAHSQCNPVLVVGETGTGKEIAARGIHAIRHPDRPFVAVNCAALTATLLESELFGHVKGSFTGADRDKTGLLELAGDGTLLLDEISEMPLDLQAKLLRVLQERTFRKVGGIKDLTCRATIIASSNRNLKKEVEEKRFRQDLYYRLDICPIVMAPLRAPSRREDIRLLAEYFLQTSSICGPRQTKPTSITPLALELLYRHSWPGNVRELRNVIERAILLETTDRIGLDSVVIEAEGVEDATGRPLPHQARDFSLEKAERELIARALHETGWQKTQAASLLGITRATLYAKVKQYNIQKGNALRSDAALPFLQPAEQEVVAVG